MRTQLPKYHVQQFEDEWELALSKLEMLDQLSVPCAMGPATLKLLFYVLKAMDAKTVLDIGTYVGTSALLFALTGCQVTTIDILPANAPPGFWAQVGRKECPRDLMNKAGVLERVEFVTSDSRDWLKHTDRKFDLICIDGWHDPRCVYEEIALALDHLTPDGLIFLDDVQTKGPPKGIDKITGPLDAINKHLAEGARFMVDPFPDLGVAFLVAKKSAFWNDEIDPDEGFPDDDDIL